MKILAEINSKNLEKSRKISKNLETSQKISRGLKGK